MGDSMSVDAAAIAALGGRLSAAHAEIEAIGAEVAEVLAEIDSGLGTGAGAQAFRRGFVGATDAALDGLADLEAGLVAQRKAMAAGIDTIVGTDRELGRDLGTAS